MLDKPLLLAVLKVRETQTDTDRHTHIDTHTHTHTHTCIIANPSPTCSALEKLAQCPRLNTKSPCDSQSLCECCDAIACRPRVVVVAFLSDCCHAVCWRCAFSLSCFLLVFKYRVVWSRHHCIELLQRFPAQQQQQHKCGRICVCVCARARVCVPAPSLRPFLLLALSSTYVGGGSRSSCGTARNAMAWKCAIFS